MKKFSITVSGGKDIRAADAPALGDKLIAPAPARSLPYLPSSWRIDIQEKLVLPWEGHRVAEGCLVVDLASSTAATVDYAPSLRPIPQAHRLDRYAAADPAADIRPSSREGTFSANLAPGQTFLLTTGADVFTGTAGDDTFNGNGLTVGAGDILIGSDGIDTLRIDGSYGYAGLESTHLEGIERLVVDGAYAGLRLGQGALLDVSHIEFTARGQNYNGVTLYSGFFDLREITIIGLEEISLYQAQVVTDNKALALSIGAVNRENTKVILSGDTFTPEERDIIFSKGILAIQDSSGTYTNAVPTFANLEGDAQRVLMGGTVLIDRSEDAIFSDDGRPATLLIALDDFWEEDLLGISTANGTVGLPDGMQVGGRVFVNGTHVGDIEEDGSWYGGLLIRFNVNATPDAVQALVRSATYTSLNPENSSPHTRAISIRATDEHGIESVVNYVYVKVENPSANPSLALGRTTHRISDTESVQLFAGAVLQDPNIDSSYTVTVALDAAQKGALTGFTAGAFVDGTYTVRGSRAEVQAQLRLLTFVPRDRDEPNSRETTTFWITITDAEENIGRSTATVTSVDGAAHHNPTNIALSKTTVYEHETAGTVVGLLSGDDADGDQLTYSLVDDAGGRFALDGNAVKVADGVKLDFEQLRQHQIKVRVEDGWGRNTEQVFEIAVRNVLHERVTGTPAADRIEGGIGNDEFKGENGNDTLVGGGGNDILWGGAGQDVFVFSHVGLINRDTIEDFDVDADRIHLVRADIFAALQQGILSEGAFQTGTRALDADDRILYDRDNSGKLFYDPDGTGSRPAIEFAVLDSGLNLLNTHFLVI